jgi:hypothetical protein
MLAGWLPISGHHHGVGASLIGTIDFQISSVIFSGHEPGTSELPSGQQDQGAAPWTHQMVLPTSSATSSLP